MAIVCSRGAMMRWRLGGIRSRPPAALRGGLHPRTGDPFRWIEQAMDNCLALTRGAAMPPIEGAPGSLKASNEYKDKLMTMDGAEVLAGAVTRGETAILDAWLAGLRAGASREVARSHPGPDCKMVLGRAGGYPTPHLLQGRSAVQNGPFSG
ncbi:hypothetical protein HCU64_22745 [Methylobacterium sp. C25]|uniref:hypothetical protein n=1 Tax=Methylobacterium sp. C25 TaxID=2721622 RepID=UPI001F33EBDF|nr:hypothetical protein [Methylobacterium sp. C25]MCE4226565.1 hypothetical protein [Methylobacterium sp. C25]